MALYRAVLTIQKTSRILNTTYSKQCFSVYILPKKRTPIHTIGCYSYHTTNTLFKRRKTAEERKSSKIIEYSPKSKSEVIDVWRDITVAELAKILERDVKYVSDIFLNEIRGANTVIHDLKRLQEAVRRSGKRTRIIAKPTDVLKELEDKDAFPRPPPKKSELKPRPPVVTVMGHVDHGKTTLLDALRNTRVVDKEFGGITQHIGAFSVILKSGAKITFLDTPGHAAFSSMRERGANVTDIVVLVVAADDGVMEQTVESIRMAKQANVPILVAINKIDSPNADIERTQRMLMQIGIQVESMGGETQSVSISALKKRNLDQLIEALVLQADLLEIGGDPNGFVEAVVVESKVHPHRGRLCTVVVQRGTLRRADILVAGTALCKVRTLRDADGVVLESVGPGNPAEIEGWRDLPPAGELVLQVESEKSARAVIKARENKQEVAKQEEDAPAIAAKEEQHNRTYKEVLQMKRSMGRYRLRNKEPRKKEIAEGIVIHNYFHNTELFIHITSINFGPALYTFIHTLTTGNTGEKMAAFSPMDPSSYSRPDLAIVTHIKISLQVSFTEKVFSGNADLTVKKIDKNVNEIILDVKNLDIETIVANVTGDILNFTISDPVEEFGSKLAIELPPGELNDFLITIYYKTKPDASGLQWLDPQQTAGKVHPFVFSQFQAIHARSFLPCQDTPGVKTKYEAVITSPSDLTVVMSAIRHGKHDMPGRSIYYFKQEVPVQTYLIAIAIGALESRKLGPRSTVWAEREIVESAAYEFANTEKQLKTAEEICGPYVWGIYDLLVLPPSFPFGGMENPCLTFVTPTLLAGDRSLANVVAHEIAHSWTGNLVTNANFEHFWLNEGFTVFIERKILGRLEGKEVQDFQAYGGTGELQETINQLGKENPLTNLVVDLKGVHPDDAFSRVPYEKGHTFLRYLENLVGGPDTFEPFLRKYFDTYKYKSVTTDQFKKFFEDNFKGTAPIDQIDWNTWLHKPGMPPVIPDYDKTLVKSIEVLKQRWLSWNETEQEVPFNVSEIDSTQMVQLLQEILEADPQPIKKLEMIEDKFKLSGVRNSEIKFRWLRIGIKAKWDKILEPTLKWVNEVGRMKFCRPLYRDLYAWKKVRNEAIKNFNNNRKSMMHVSAYTVAKDLKLN